ncbi:aminotransferase-like domain-containing protein [Paenibacillus glycinis]|uniref:Aminotransferase class I/II-fold pyridoxal phosphate-dependent enzyme n=1 Tax=Paenibacillus glycinis TaxID=2697035 RepID=A0ABW9XTZ6_9BACL|nr:PLP-dependent aminotransferase family protein [Paenibacillus glycinis]NBD26134.1 aminotransferase class I/II-fold pyridoxal phosphate-dependent enzyme [Paenibacillus glycinis]
MKNRLARRALRSGEASLSEMLALPGQPISFAGDLPAEGGISPAVIEQARERAAGGGDARLRSLPPQGIPALRELLAKRMAGKGIQTEPSEILLTANPERTVRIIIEALLTPGDSALVETPSHPAILRALRASGIEILQAPCDREGMLIAEAERLIEEHRPKLIHAMPALGNPASTSWSAPRREALLALSRRHGIVVLEEDSYGDLLYKESDSRPSLYAMDRETGGNGVICVSTFAAALSPQLRTGWAVAGTALIDKLLEAEAEAKAAPEFARDQETLLQLLLHHDIEDDLRKISMSYMERMNQLQALLRKHDGVGLAWEAPIGGMFLWLTLPEGLDAEALLRCASAKGVTFDPGISFYASDAPRNRLRLSIAHASGKRLEEGIDRLAEAINEFLART